MAFNIKDLNYDKDSKERMPWEHYLELFGQTDPMEIPKGFRSHTRRKKRHLP